MECSSSFQERFIDSSTTSNNSDRRSCTSTDGLLRTTREPDARLVIFGSVTNDGCIVSRCPGQSSTVADLFFDVADDGTFRHVCDGEDISYSQGRLFAAVDECTSV